MEPLPRYPKTAVRIIITAQNHEKIKDSLETIEAIDAPADGPHGEYVACMCVSGILRISQTFDDITKAFEWAEAHRYPNVLRNKYDRQIDAVLEDSERQDNDPCRHAIGVDHITEICQMPIEILPLENVVFRRICYYTPAREPSYTAVYRRSDCIYGRTLVGTCGYFPWRTLVGTCGYFPGRTPVGTCGYFPSKDATPFVVPEEPPLSPDYCFRIGEDSVPVEYDKKWIHSVQLKKNE